MGALIVVALWGIIIIGTSALASSKGRSGLLWFLLSIPFGIFAFFLVALLPQIVEPALRKSLVLAPTLNRSIPRKSIPYRLGMIWAKGGSTAKLFWGTLFVLVMWTLLRSPDIQELAGTNPVASFSASVPALAPKVTEKLASETKRDQVEAKKKVDQEERERLTQVKAEARRKKSEGVSIGMSKEDVLASKWGKPQSVNKTTTTYGTHEQWVYGLHNYLYFSNDTLTTIQN